MSNYCIYYQAQVKQAWLLAALLKSYEHVAFDRTLNVERQIFEFFVPVGCQAQFLEFMQVMVAENVICDLVELPNRLITAENIWE